MSEIATTPDMGADIACKIAEVGGSFWGVSSVLVFMRSGSVF